MNNQESHGRVIDMLWGKFQNESYSSSRDLFVIRF
ncbi:hypothetical protein ABIE17_002793 [Lelliottia nimipressuralis]